MCKPVASIKTDSIGPRLSACRTVIVPNPSPPPPAAWNDLPTHGADGMSCRGTVPGASTLVVTVEG